MAIYDIETAKDLYYLNPQDTDAHNAVLTKSIDSAKVLFQSKVTPDLLDMYENVENPISVKSQDGNTLVIDEDDYIPSTSRIYIDSKGYQIDEVSTDSATGDIELTTKRDLPENVTEFTTSLLTNLEIIWGYCLVYQFTISGRELVVKDILYSKDRYEEGSLLPATEESLENLRDSILADISRVVDVVKSETGIVGSPVFLRR